MASVNEDLRDRILKAHIDIQRYGQSAVNQVLKLLSSADADLLNQITKRIEAGKGGTWTTVRLTKLLNDIGKINDAIYKRAEDLMRSEQGDLADHAAESAMDSLKGALPAEAAALVSFTMPTSQRLLALIDNSPIRVGDAGSLLLEEIFRTLAKGKENTIRQAVRVGMMEGQTVQEITQRLRGTRANNYTDGLLETSRRNATSMVRTIVNSTANRAADIVYKENQDLIKGLKWSATLDSRTTPICQARDGKVFPVDEGPRPPAHINCRSLMIPVLKSWRELGINVDDIPPSTRASMNGQVPAETTYQEWLKSQPEEVQRDVLGPSRFKLFSEGVSLDKFVADGRALTLEEIRSRRKNNA